MNGWMEWGCWTAGPAVMPGVWYSAHCVLHLLVYFWCFFTLIRFFLWLVFGPRLIRICLWFGSLTVGRCSAKAYSVFFSLMNVFLFSGNLGVVVSVHGEIRSQVISQTWRFLGKLKSAVSKWGKGFFCDFQFVCLLVWLQQIRTCLRENSPSWNVVLVLVWDVQLRFYSFIKNCSYLWLGITKKLDEERRRNFAGRIDLKIPSATEQLTNINLRFSYS